MKDASENGANCMHGQKREKINLKKMEMIKTGMVIWQKMCVSIVFT